MIKGGPKIINDGLVLCLDAHDAKSYAGEPTTNLSPNSDYSGASLDTINSGSNGGWGTTFDRWISEIEGPGGKTVKAFYLKLTGSTGSAPHAEGGAYEVSGIDSQYASLTSGNSYRVSAWAKVVRADGSSTSHSNANVLYLTGTASLGSSTMTVGTEWTKISASFSISSTGNYRLRHYFYSVSVGDILVITEPQIELKSYNTPYVLSSRSATNGWVDRTTNNNDGTLTNMIGTGASHYRDGQVIMPVANSYLDFDATDDRVAIGSIGSMTAFTVELWINPDAVQDYQNPIDCNYSYNGTTGNIGPRLELRTGASPNWIISGDTGNNNNYYYIVARSGAPSAGTWYHAALTYDGSGNASGLKSYWDGSLVTSGATNVNTPSAVWVNTMNNVQLGLGFHLGSSRHFNGQISTTKIYNKALTAAQILSNYNATKGRFL